MSNFIFTLIIVTSLWEGRCDAYSIFSQINAMTTQTALLIQNLDNSISLWFQDKAMLEQSSSELILTVTNTLSNYKIFQTASLGCAELDINRDIVKVVQDSLRNECPGAPIAKQFEQTYEKSIKLLNSKQDVEFYQKLVNEQSDFNTDYQNQLQFYNRLQAIAFQQIQNSVAKYKNCISVYGSPQNQNPSQCDAYNNLTNARSIIHNNYRGIGQSFGRLFKLPIFDLEFKNKSLLNATTSQQQLNNSLSPQLTRITNKLSECNANASNSLNLAKQGLNAVARIKNQIDIKIQKIVEQKTKIDQILIKLMGQLSIIRSLMGSIMVI